MFAQVSDRHLCDRDHHGIVTTSKWEIEPGGKPKEQAKGTNEIREYGESCDKKKLILYPSSSETTDGVIHISSIS